jgi:hypothetical protein
VNGIGLPAKQEAFAAAMPDFNIGAAGDCGRESQTRNTARGSVNLTLIVGYFRNLLQMTYTSYYLHAIKCIKQPSCSLEPLFPLMKTFRQMVNGCIRIGLDNDVSTMKKLSSLAYH